MSHNSRKLGAELFPTGEAWFTGGLGLYLKRLEIKGFKSFADNTELILEPGINIIVGPNGCGKSNIADAIRWVLGEGNVRHLRGQKNEDIIFNGTDKQKAQGMALVDMTIDNSDGVLPVAFGEVSIGRKIFRSGESEYWLNKSRVRMKDVVTLFTGTGLGKRGYSLISQGELEQVLNGQPFDRRLILEEASGTIKYRQQRDEVKQRINASSHDLQRVADIMGELAIRSDELANKSARAQSYLQIWEQYSLIDKELIASEILDIDKNLIIKNDELGRKREEHQAVSQRLEESGARLKEAEARFEAGRHSLSGLKDQKYLLESQISQLESEITLAQERINNCQERKLAAEQDAQKYVQLLGTLSIDLDKQLTDYQVEKEKWQQRDQVFAELKSEILELGKSITVRQERFELYRNQIFEQANRESQIKNNILSREESLKRSREKNDRLQMRMEDGKNKTRLDEEKMQTLDREKQDRLLFLQDRHKQFALISEQHSSRKHEMEQLEAEFQEINREIIALENKLLGLQDLDRKYVGFSESIRTVLEAHNGGEKSLRGIKGLMANIIDVPAGMELAIEVAAGKGLENIVVTAATDAREAIYFLKRKGLGRVTFLPLDSLRVQKLDSRVIEKLGQQEGVLGLASQLLSFDPQFEKAVEYLLGRVLLVSDLDRGMKIFKHSQLPLRIVSLDGELINFSGAMTGGTMNRHKSSPLQRKGEARKLEQRTQNLRIDLENNRLSSDKLTRQVKSLDEELIAARNGIAEEEFQIKLIEAEIDSSKVNLEQVQSEILLQQQEIAALQENIQTLNQEIFQLEQEYTQLCKENSNFTEQLEQMKDLLENERREYEVRKERAISQQDQLDMKKKELENLARNIDQFTEVKKSYRQSLDEARRLQERLDKDVHLQEEILLRSSNLIQSQKEQMKDIITIINREQDEQQLHSANMESLRSHIGPLLEEGKLLEENIRSVEIRMVRIETELEAARNKWAEKYPQEEAIHYAKDLAAGVLREYRRRAEALKEEIELLGPVDIESIKEYHEVKSRYDFLQQQSSDLTAARDSLEKLLTETEKIMAKNFAQFLILANESFKRTFTEIFGGGEAQLVLEADSDYLTAGVDMLIKMPGKRHQSLNLLSGGERALTCIAFIFALLRLRPAPFCLLDEIDAALDETNLMRFTDFLKKMAGDIQFIVITHRQATIEAGSSIYGVTMPQEGISSILSLDVEHSISLAM